MTTDGDRVRYVVDATRSAILVQARSTVGTLSFGSSRLGGEVWLAPDGAGIDLATPPTAVVTVPMDSLTSGNTLYDAELQRRLSIRRFPQVTLELTQVTGVNGTDYQATGVVTLHGVTATLSGVVDLSFPEPGVLMATGEHVMDVREFDIDVPTVLMLRIYPDVSISLQLVATEQAAAGEAG